MSKIRSRQNSFEIPVLPLRDAVIFPYMVVPLIVGRQISVRGIEYTLSNNQEILIVTQSNPSVEELSINDLYKVGTLGTVLQMLRLPDGSMKILVEAHQRYSVSEYVLKNDILFAKAEKLENEQEDVKEIDTLMRTVIHQFEQYSKLNHKIPAEILSSVIGIEDVARFVDTVAAHINVKLPDKQIILETKNLKERLEKIIILLENELDILETEKTIRHRVKGQMEKNQKEYYLNEQMKAIQKELGELSKISEGESDLSKLEKQIRQSGMPKEAQEKAMTELHKMQMMSPLSPESTVSRNYLDWLLKLPWKKRSVIKRDLLQAEDLLNKAHYGLDKVKERILEYLAVTQRVKKLKGPILCLVGPPGVGKTSLGESIAQATGRTFVRFSLGGVRDEAEIRGHRRTYIGAMPGKILQMMSKAGTKNPLILLDEIDKMAMDFRGDPASALLEVLDPAQNQYFNDHYLEIDYDLSDVMFVATANSMNIPEPLLDRMEVIRLAGYTEDEKSTIANKYLIPKQFEANGLKTGELSFNTSAIISIIRYYTREAGVRNLEREISKVCRKVVRDEQNGQHKKNRQLSSKNIEEYLGIQRFHYGRAEEENRVGQVTGLAWTQAGGDLLTIEVATVPDGKGDVKRTGNLEQVMRESIDAAITVVRTRALSLGIKTNFSLKTDIHFHVPEGAIKKDGPSAGIAMCVALASSLTNIPVKAEVAMTGEITLRGEVLAIGGLKEKLLAAHRGGIKTVLIPFDNEKDLREIPENVKANLVIRPVRWIDEVFEHALQSTPKTLKTAKITAKKSRAEKEKKRS